MSLAYAMTVCILFVCSRSGIVFNPSAGAITTNASNTAVNSDDNASSRTSLAWLQFCKRNRIDDYVFLLLTSDLHAKKNETIRISFCSHRVSSPLSQENDLKRAGMCINESDRPPYLNSFLVTSPA